MSRPEDTVAQMANKNMSIQRPNLYHSINTDERPIPMKLNIDNNAASPVFQQIIDQLHFSINTGELKPGDKLPSIRNIATENDIAANTVAKALRQLEFRGVIIAKDRSGFVVAKAANSRYQARGVSADKTEVHNVVDLSLIHI